MLNIECTKHMKSTETSKYPYLGVSRETGAIVLFQSPRKGVKMGTSPPVFVGGSRIRGVPPLTFVPHDDWHEGHFDYYNGEVVISNEAVKS